MDVNDGIADGPGAGAGAGAGALDKTITFTFDAPYNVGLTPSVFPSLDNNPADATYKLSSPAL